MALFGKLFEKKQCSICGSDIGLLGNRKLEDGNCCKACAAKLSPWFSERRQSTVEDIKAQLEYREANQDQVAAFHATRTLGESTKVILDEDAGKFLVTSARNWQSANPDVLSFSDVTGCNLDIDEDRTEIEYKDREGNRQSFSPKRYAYSYDFYIVIHVNNPYFNEIRFKLNSSKVDRNIEIVEAMEDLRSWFSENGLFEEYADELEYLTVSHVLLDACIRVIRQAGSSHPRVRKLRSYALEKCPDPDKNKYCRKISGNRKTVYRLLKAGMVRTVGLIFKIKK